MKTELLKLVTSSVLALLTAASVAYLWRDHVTLLVFVLLCIGALMFLVERDRGAILLYIIIFILGPLSEAVVIFFGAWSYADPHIIGISIWLPFVWGNAGLFISRISHFVHWVLAMQKGNRKVI